MFNKITCSVLDYPSTSDDDEMLNVASKSTLLKHRIKHLRKETRLCCREASNLVRRGQNIRAEISLMEKTTLKVMRVFSKYNTIIKKIRE